MNSPIYDLVIIGAGPAGLSAAIYAKRGNLNVIILEKNVPGGQLVNINKIANYPGYKDLDGANLAYIMYEQVNDLEIPMIFEQVIDVHINDEYKEIVTEKNSYKSKNIIVATGTTYQNLKINNEKKFIGKGISYCAICDGKLFTNQDIAILINNNHALKDCLYLEQFVNNIYLIYNENVNLTKEILNNQKYHLLYNYNISKLIGDEFLNKIEVTNNNETKIIDVNGLFVLNTTLPVNSFLSDYPIFSSNGYMQVDNHCESKIPGLFGIGDVVDKSLKQVITACADGAIAAQHIASNRQKYLK